MKTFATLALISFASGAQLQKQVEDAMQYAQTDEGIVVPVAGGLEATGEDGGECNIRLVCRTGAPQIPDHRRLWRCWCGHRRVAAAIATNTAAAAIAMLQSHGSCWRVAVATAAATTTAAVVVLRLHGVPCPAWPQ